MFPKKIVGEAHYGDYIAHTTLRTLLRYVLCTGTGAAIYNRVSDFLTGRSMQVLFYDVLWCMVNITSRLPLESVLRSPLFPPCVYDIWCDKQFSRVRHAVNARIIAPTSSKDHPLNFESYLLKDEHWAHQGNITMNIIKRAIYWCSNSNSGANSNCQLLVAHRTSLRFSPLSIR